jgi:hypothetical protein
MADRQFAGLNEFGPSAPLRDIYAYYEGDTRAIRKPAEYFPNDQIKQRHFSELLARLLSEQKYRQVVADWGLKEDASGAERTAQALVAFSNNPSAAAAWSTRENPNYLAPPPLRGKSDFYR